MNALRVYTRFINVLLALLISGCAELEYYAQSAHGQFDIVERRKPIDKLLVDESVDPQLKERLARVKQIREFAVGQLALPATGSYTRYADLERDYAVLALYAAPEFSTELHTWCYPVIGCAAYRGYFDRDMLAAYVGELKHQQFDTYIVRVPAYSTLGWFEDPVLNTVLDWPDPQLAGLIFHELSHQKLYIKGDTVFNESFATAVGRVGVKRWLRVHGDRQAMMRYQAHWQHRRRVVELIAEIRFELEHLYKEDLPAEELRARKRERLEASRVEYSALREAWEEDPGYDDWFGSELNNAKLGAAEAYHTYVDAFLALLDELNNDLTAFYTKAAAIGALVPEQRERCLQAYLDNEASACELLLQH